MTTTELAQQILLWIRKVKGEQPTRANPTTVVVSQLYDLITDIETLCKEQLGTKPAPISGITEGRMCHYTAYNGRCLAALIIGHEATNVDLVVFTNLANFNGVKNFGTQFHQGVEHSEELRPGTWHWIERA